VLVEMGTSTVEPPSVEPRLQWPGPVKQPQQPSEATDRTFRPARALQSGHSERVASVVEEIVCRHCGARNPVAHCPRCGRRWVVVHDAHEDVQGICAFERFKVAGRLTDAVAAGLRQATCTTCHTECLSAE
jgi:hypothetical protein